ncbi:MAG: hypothetical protein CMJ18_25310 [Phycisphaeraceae bacterium]|nr:hypothetical protein [Phycisphaeraceae bacterium]
MPLMSTLDIAFVGCGAIAEYHLAGVKELGDRARVTALVDLNRSRAEQLAQEADGDPAIYGTLDEALAAGGFDAVVLMLPHDLHEPCSMACFDAGKHLLLEKPLGRTLEECMRICDAAAKTDTVFLVGENTPHWEAVKRARALVEEGAIGEIIAADSCYIGSYDTTWWPPGSWRLDKERTGGGFSIDGGTHWIRPLRHWIGRVSQVIAATGRPIEIMEGESLNNSIWRFASGAVATFRGLIVDAPVGPTTWYRVTGTKGQFAIDTDLFSGDAVLQLFNHEHPEGTVVTRSGGYFSAFIPQMADFVSTVLDGTAPLAGPDEAIGDLEVIWAMYRSVESGQWEEVRG